MAAPTRRAVLTGIGVISPIGCDAASFWQSLEGGRSGVRAIQNFDASGLPIRIAGEIRHFDAKKIIDKKQAKSLKVMARTIQLAVAAAQLAMNDSGVDRERLDPARFGVEFGAALIATELEEIGPAAQVSVNCQPGSVDLEKWGKEGLESMPPLWMLKYLPNMLACHVSILQNAQGPNNTITQSDVAGLLAMGEAYRILARNQADFFLVGGADSKVNPLSMVRQCLFQTLSKRNEEPEKACRPFDKRRDGLVIGEGAAVFAVEALEHAQQRGARILAEIVGFGSSFDRHRTGAGLARAIRAALHEAGIGPEQLDHTNAHANGAVDLDVFEAKGLEEVFAGRDIPVFAPKSYFGNLGAGGAIVELAASVLAMQHRVLPRTLNYEEPDPACPVLVVSAPRPIRQPYFLKTSYTETGQCAALVVRRWE